MSAVPSARLVEHIPHTLIWDNVICPKIAQKKELSPSKSFGTSASTNDTGRYEGQGSGAGYGVGTDGQEQSVHIAA